MRFTEEHEWLRLEADGTVAVGITDYAQEALGDLVFVQLPELRAYSKGEEVAVLESVKAASNITMPLDGDVLEINEALSDAPEQVNQDPLQTGWFFRMRPADPEALGTLLTEADYAKLTKA
jgi:glycine cleavage system H protein